MQWTHYKFWVRGEVALEYQLDPERVRRLHAEPMVSGKLCDLLGDFAAADTVILGISPDSVASHRRFCDKKELGVTLLTDPDKVAAEALGAWGEKKKYGRTFMGIIRSTYLIGKDGTVAAAWPKVRVKGHAAAVLEAAQNLS